jgi:hypothetical protein
MRKYTFLQKTKSFLEYYYSFLFDVIVHAAPSEFPRPSGLAAGIEPIFRENVLS